MMAPAKDDTPTAEGADEKPVILVVEDEVLIRMVIAEYLRDCGYQVVEAGNGREAISLFEAGLEVEVVFTDVQMPGDTDGFALARWLRPHHPGIKVIITSGVAKACDAAEDLCEDGPLLQKPYEAAEVERRIKLLIELRRQRQPR